MTKVLKMITMAFISIILVVVIIHFDIPDNLLEDRISSQT